MTKIHQKLLVLIIIILNCITIMIGDNVSASNTTIASNVDVKDRLELIKEKGVLTVASSNDIPFAFIDPKTNELTGVDAEIITEVARRLGVNKVEMKEFALKDLVTELNTNDDIDMITGGLYITDERKKEALFTDIWYTDSEAIIIPKFSKITSKESLKDAVIGAQEGTTFLKLAQKWQKDGLVKDVVIFKNVAELLSAVNTGKVDAIMTDRVAALYILPRDKNLYLKILIPYESENIGNVAAVVRKSDTTLANAVNEKVNEMRNDRTLFKILEKYGIKYKTE